MAREKTRGKLSVDMHPHFHSLLTRLVARFGTQPKVIYAALLAFDRLEAADQGALVVEACAKSPRKGRKIVG